MKIPSREGRKATIFYIFLILQRDLEEKLKINGNPEKSHAGYYVLCGSTMSNQRALKGYSIRAEFWMTDSTAATGIFQQIGQKVTPAASLLCYVTPQPGAKVSLCCREGREGVLAWDMNCTWQLKVLPWSEGCASTFPKLCTN